MFKYLTAGNYSNVTVASSDYLFVQSGATVTGLVNNGYVVVQQGGSVDGTTFGSSGYESVDAGGSVTNTDLNNGGYLNVQSGATSTGATVENGGFLNDATGASAINTVVQPGGYFEVDGTAASTVVYTGGTLHVGPGGTAIGTTNASPACYLRGTLLRSVGGDVAVEALRVGDRLPTLSGRIRPIIWIGRRRIDCRQHPSPRSVQPMRILANAFADGMPRRDLFLSPEHAVFAGGALIPIGALENGISVRQCDVDEVEYFHVELASHDVVLAEGMPAETFFENGNRDDFDAIEDQAVRLQPTMRCSDPCWRILRQGPEVAAVRATLLRRSFGAVPRAA